MFVNFGRKDSPKIICLGLNFELVGQSTNRLIQPNQIEKSVRFHFVLNLVLTISVRSVWFLNPNSSIWIAKKLGKNQTKLIRTHPYDTCC